MLTGEEDMSDDMGNGLRYLGILVGWGFFVILLFPGSAALAGDNHGAIAFATGNGAYGYSFNYSSRVEAERAALRQCLDQGGEGCKATVYFRNACGALVRSGRTGFGAAWATTGELASQQAMQSCRRYNSNCGVVQVVCTDR